MAWALPVLMMEKRPVPEIAARALTADLTVGDLYPGSWLAYASD